MELAKLSALEIASLVKRKEITPKEVVSYFLERIGTYNDELNAFLSVYPEEALREAERVDIDSSPLAGLPIAVKDNILAVGTRTTCASRILENYESPYDATVVEKIRKAGMIIVGKTNMDEFAMGSSTEYSAFGPTRNPWDLSRVPGGSSGGSAAAVSAGLTPLSLGSDTGGSIRQPASFCGVVGVKPTYGRVSRYGLVAFGSSLDQIGPLARTVEDAASLLQIIAGHDEKDSTSSEIEVEDYLAFVKSFAGKDAPLKGVKFALPKEFFSVGGMDKGVSDVVNELVSFLSSEGAVVEEVSLPYLNYSVETYYIVAPAEASSNLARYDGVRYGYRSPEADDVISIYFDSRGEAFGREVKRRILIGTFVLSAGYYEAYYNKAQQVRELLRRDFERVFEGYDFVLAPTSPTVAFRFGEKTSDPVKMYLSDVFTISANLAGVPAVSVPYGLSEGLPVGIQIIAPWFSEARMLGVASVIQRDIGFPEKFFNE